MNLLLAFLLQADKTGKQPTTNVPRLESGFPRLMIIVFIVTVTMAAAGAIWMILRGAAGAAEAKLGEEEKK